jgi:hypothetical protein
MCRKAHGAAFATYASARRRDFRWLAGEDWVQVYSSSPGVERTFCRQCGSTLQFIEDKKPDSVEIALGTLDDDPTIRPNYHHIGHLEKLISPLLEKPTTLEVSLSILNSSIGFSIELN